MRCYSSLHKQTLGVSKMMIEGIKSTDVVSKLTLSCIKHNYVEFVDEWGYELGTQKIAELFGNQWELCKYEVMQWYDLDYKGVVNG